MNEPIYKAVDDAGLVALLGRQCSPDPSRGHYVVGPCGNPTDGNYRRWAHLASCRSAKEARELAERYDANFRNRPSLVGCLRINNRRDS